MFDLCVRIREQIANKTCRACRLAAAPQDRALASWVTSHVSASRRGERILLGIISGARLCSRLRWSLSSGQKCSHFAAPLLRPLPATIQGTTENCVNVAASMVPQHALVPLAEYLEHLAAPVKEGAFALVNRANANFHMPPSASACWTAARLIGNLPRSEMPMQ